MFQHTANELQQAAQAALDLAKQKGATAAEVDLSESLGQSVQVRWREIEQIEYQQDQSLDITVFVGHSKGRASTADLSPTALASTVQAACDIARYTAEDPFAGIADADLMATHIADLDRYHEWNLSSENAIAIAKECEEAALSADSRISNSEGASVNTAHFQFVYANSHSFCQHQRGTRHSLSCSVVASDENGMERDFWYDLASDHHDLDTPAHIGRTAAERATRRLSPQTVATGNYPILFDAAVAGSLIGHIVGGLNGGVLYRQSSFLQDSLGTQILPSFISLREEPHIPRALGSTYFDSEGVATQPRFVIENGIVRGYFLDSYRAQAQANQHRQRRRRTQSLSNRHRKQPNRPAQTNGHRLAHHRTDGTRREHAHGRLFARRSGILGRKWHHPPPRFRHHHRRQPERNVAQHRRHRQRFPPQR